jgi:hypothetical protein
MTKTATNTSATILSVTAQVARVQAERHSFLGLSGTISAQTGIHARAAEGLVDGKVIQLQTKRVIEMKYLERLNIHDYLEAIGANPPPIDERELAEAKANMIMVESIGEVVQVLQLLDEADEAMK